MKKIKQSKIYLSFFMVSLCTFGGGYAMLPMLEKEIVEKHRWISREELIDLFAVAQGLPGLIGINVACLICSKICDSSDEIADIDSKGADSNSENADSNSENADSNSKSVDNKKTNRTALLANIVATAGVMTPCVIIILLIAILLGQFREIEIVRHALAGIAICVLALIVKTVITMWKSSIKSIPQIFVFLAAAVVTIFTGISPVVTILAGAVLGIVAGLIFDKKAEKASEADKATDIDDEGGER